MHRQTHILLLLTILSFLSLTLAASSTSFCKCTCFSNSTIIQLDGTSSASTAQSPVADGGAADAGAIGDSTKTGHGSCLDCNKKFCLEYNLPICKGAGEDDVFTTCFQRDSAKDEAVVFIFIFATVGLLVYAAIRPWLERWLETARRRRSYVPVSTAQQEES